MKRLKTKSIEVVAYEPTLKETHFYTYAVITDLDYDYFLYGLILDFIQNYKLLEYKYTALYSAACIKHKLETNSSLKSIN